MVVSGYLVAYSSLRDGETYSGTGALDSAGVAHIIEAAKAAGVIKRRSLEQVVLDTTVQSKAVPLGAGDSPRNTLLLEH